MNTKKLFGVDTIGAIKGNQFKPSMMGLAIKNDAGDYVTYDPKTNSITNVADMVFDGFDTVFAIPSPVVAVGDLILRGSEPLYVKSINEDGSITVINPVTDRQEDYLPQKTLFGFRIYIKVISLFGSVIPTVNGDSNVNGLSSMLPYLLMTNSMEDGSVKDILPLLLFGNMGGGNIFGGTTGDDNKDQSNLTNALLLMTLFGDSKDKSNKDYTKKPSDSVIAEKASKNVTDREEYAAKVKARLHSLPTEKEARVRKEIDRRKKTKHVSTIKWEEVEDIMNILGV